MVGTSPTKSSTEFLLDESKKAFNPFIESGALAVASLLDAGSDPSNRIANLLSRLEKLSGSHITCSMVSYLHRISNVDKENALAYWLVRIIIIFN